ncbi:MAG: translation initiation factor IF-5A [Candidatus Diapherotrites archaeon]|nr:translation initiation factor IF-5A [Candidatus Diapherotrites archaeon]
MTDVEKRFVAAGQLKEGNYVLIDDDVCQVREVEKSKPGKHGAAKTRITAISVFTDAKKTLLKPVDADVEVPIIKRGTAQVVAIVGNNISIMDTSSYEMFESAKPKEVPDLKNGDEVEYIRFGSKVRIVRKK